MTNEFKKGRIEDAIRRNQLRRTVWVGLALAAIGALIFSGIAYSRWKSGNLPGIAVPDQGREHVTTTNHPPYNSNPPVSGWHYPQPAEWGVYHEELADEIIIHNLEHGGVWISYKPDIPEEVRLKLESFFEKYGRKIIVTPRPQNDTEIALAAWGRLDKFGLAEYSEERVDKFIRAFRNKGPEFVP